MAALTTQVIDTDGTAPTFVAASASDTADIGSGRNTFAVYKNDSAGSVTVTVTPDAELDSGDAYPDKVYTVAAGAEAWIPLIKDYASTADPSRCTITTSTQDPGITVAVVRR